MTVLFADLVGFTARAEELDPEDVEAILRPYHERLRSELERFGGTVEKFIGDAVMALFGAPVAHEDDPERAVRAALAIRDWALEGGNVQVRIAVSTGEALINLSARPEAGEGMAAGDVVNTTARMEAAAPMNGVLVGETTYRATRHAIDYRDTEPFAAKGKAEPVRVWEAVATRARVGLEMATRTPLVGRARELDQLRDGFDRVRQNRAPQLVTVVGVPGIGKSRLVYEFAQTLEAESELTLWRHGRSLPYGDGVTFWALAEMVKAQCGILESDSAAEAAEKLRSGLSQLVEAHELDWLEAKLQPLVGIAGDIGSGDRSESFAAWRRFFEALATQRPLVLAFEDLHWADDDLLDFVDELADWAESVPLLILCTARPELLDRRAGWGGGKRNALTISLAPLDNPDTARLIAHLIERAVLPAETQATLLARAGGNPLYAEQFVRMFSERDGGEMADLPETVQGIVAARLDALPATEKALLQDAAVFGKVFWSGALSAISGLERRAIEENLRSLARKEFVRREVRPSIAGELEYAFIHQLVRDVAYGQLPRAERARKHERAAEWIESLAAERSDDRAEMLAHHYLCALEFAAAAGMDTEHLASSARTVLRDAAERAYALGSFQQVVRLASAAIDLWPERSLERTHLQLLRAHARHEIGEGVDLDELGRVSARLVAENLVEAAADAEMLRAGAEWNLGHGEAAEEHADRALELVRDARPSPTKAAVLVERARLLMLAAHFDRAAELGGEGLALANELGLERLEASALITIGVGLHGKPEALENLQRGLQIALRLNDRRQIQRGYNNLAEELARRGQWREVGPVYEEQERTLGRIGDEYSHWRDAQQAMYSYYCGDWARARTRAERLLAAVDSGTHHYQEFAARFARALMRYACDDVDGALADAEAGARAARTARDPQAISGLAMYAFLLVAEGEMEHGSSLLDEVIATGYFDFYFAIEFAFAMSALGREQELRQAIDNAGLAKPWADLGLALASRDFAQAADTLNALGIPTYEAHARLRNARQLAVAGRRPEADIELRQALSFWRSVGARRYIREGEALLAATA